MSYYLEEIKQKVKDGKAEVVENYKQFVEEVIVPDLIKQEGTTCVHVSKQELIDADILSKPFQEWLKAEGFSVTLNKGDSTLSISY